MRFVHDWTLLHAWREECCAALPAATWSKWSPQDDRAHPACQNPVTSCKHGGGEVAERLNAAVSKTVKPCKGFRGFESLPLRQFDDSALSRDAAADCLAAHRWLNAPVPSPPRALAMTSNSPDGWDASAAAWIASQGDEGDFGRKYVLEARMLERVTGRGFTTALDIGCGEGRFSRAMQNVGIRTVGIDPTGALIARARELDPPGDYRLARAETLDVAPGSFDLVVSYLSLVDIADLALATAKLVAAQRPGGTLLIANLNSFNTAGMRDASSRDADGDRKSVV